MRTCTKTINKSDSVFFRVWEAASSSRPTICLVHGLSEHSGRYEWLAEQFNAKGYSVVACDLRGHGHSSGQRGHASRYTDLLDDIDRLVQFTCDELSPESIVVYGHSMGGNLVINHALRRQPERNGLVRAFVVTSPMLLTAEAPPLWKVGLGRMLYRLVPSFSLSNGIDLTHLSRDAAYVDSVRNDPIRHGRLSAGLGINLIESGKWASGNAAQLKHPMLLVHGDADRITSYDASRKFADDAGDLCEFHSWPDGRHELHQDIEREKVIAMIEQWLSER